MPALSVDTMQDHSSLPAPSAPVSSRPTAAVIDLGAIEHNFREVMRRAEGRKVLAVVKAQAYGHGAVRVSRRLLALGAGMLGVALVEEGKELRDAGIEAPILLMGPMFPEQAEAVCNAQPDAGGLFHARRPRACRSRAETREEDFRPCEDRYRHGQDRRYPRGTRPDSSRSFSGLSGIEVTGLMTHFADADLRDKKFASEQMDRFEALLRELDARGITIPLRHAANSAAILDFRRALFTMVRPGTDAVRVQPARSRRGERGPQAGAVARDAHRFPEKNARRRSDQLRRTFVTKRESIIATLPIGYADGYSRGLSNKGEALVRGRRARWQAGCAWTCA